MILGAQSIIPLPIIDVPELILRVICMSIEPFHSRQFFDFLFNDTICFDEYFRVNRTWSPNADIEEHPFLGHHGSGKLLNVWW